MSSSVRSATVTPEPLRAPTPTANDFPTPQGQMFHVTKRDQGLVSPAQSSFSFPDEEQPHAVSTPGESMEEKSTIRKPDRGAAEESAIRSATNGTPQQQELRKKKSQFYSEVFSYREPNLSPKDRIYKDSVVTAEVRTNVIVRRNIHRRLMHQADPSVDNRSRTNTNSCKTFPSSCRNGTRDLPPPYSLPSTIRHASCSAEPSIQPTCSPSALYLPNSFLRPTSEMLPCFKPIWPTP